VLYFSMAYGEFSPVKIPPPSGSGVTVSVPLSNLPPESPHSRIRTTTTAARRRRQSHLIGIASPSAPSQDSPQCARRVPLLLSRSQRGAQLASPGLAVRPPSPRSLKPNEPPRRRAALPARSPPEAVVLVSRAAPVPGGWLRVGGALLR
jgi:hypothetical protein